MAKKVGVPKPEETFEDLLIEPTPSRPMTRNTFSQLPIRVTPIRIVVTRTLVRQSLKVKEGIRIVQAEEFLRIVTDRCVL